MSNELFYIIFTPVVIGLFIYAAYAESVFQKVKRDAESLTIKTKRSK